MFVEVIKSRSKNGKVYETWLVRTSIRTPNGPRSRTVCNITRLPPATRLLIASSLKGQPLVSPDAAALEGALDFGGLAVLRDAWARLGLADLFAGLPAAVGGRLQAIVFSRLLFPCAKLSVADRARGSLLAAACGLAPGEAFNEEDLYAAMDQLTGRWTGLVQGLYRKAFPRKVRIALYDITSVYFEGKGPKGLARYGYSRDHRGDRPQVNLAVVTDEQGIPISVSVLRGNRADSKTLLGLLKLLRRRFGIESATFVFDGGMSGEINLQAMREAGLSYVTRLSNATLESLLKDLPETAACAGQLELGDKPQLIELEHEGRRYVLAGGAWRADRDRQRRAARIAKGEEALRKLAAARRKKPDAQKLASSTGRRLEALKAHKYFDYRVDEAGQLQWSRKEDVIARESQHDGWYLLHTNLPASGPQALGKEKVLSHYKGLLEVEDAFRELKTYLEVRPIYHYRPDRVVNHIRLCFVAYWLSARLGAEWGLRGQHAEVVRVLRRLQHIRVGRLSFAGEHHRTLLTAVPADLEATLRELKLTKLFATPPAWANPADRSL